MRAGLLNTRVIIQRRSAGTDPLGQPLDTWETWQTVWAHERMPTGLQTIATHADKPFAKQRLSLRIRQTGCAKSITAGMRAVVRGTTYNITATPLQGRDAIDLVCEAV
jgi:SPP1 family predicted phage head-tail adaptor